jgi:Protein of unknown function (DUF559)
MAEVAASNGVITRERALEAVDHHVLDRAVDAGVLVRVFPRVYVVAELATDEMTRYRAATQSSGGALSHLSALRIWGLPGAPVVSDIHVAVEPGCQPRRTHGLVVHRRRGFTMDGPETLVRHGIPVLRIESAIIDSWMLLPESDRRGLIIVAVRERRTTPTRLLAATRMNPRCGGVSEQRELVNNVRNGCHSELELWGFRRVFDHPGLPRSVGQHPVRLRGRTAYLDRAFLAQMVNVEMDGAAYHFLPGQRELDMQRDAELAALGWLVVRFSWRRLHADPEGCRTELLRTLATRTAQLGLRSA